MRKFILTIVMSLAVLFTANAQHQSYTFSSVKYAEISKETTTVLEERDYEFEGTILLDLRPEVGYIGSVITYDSEDNMTRSFFKIEDIFIENDSYNIQAITKGDTSLVAITFILNKDWMMINFISSTKYTVNVLSYNIIYKK